MLNINVAKESMTKVLTCQFVRMRDTMHSVIQELGKPGWDEHESIKLQSKAETAEKLKMWVSVKVEKLVDTDMCMQSSK